MRSSVRLANARTSKPAYRVTSKVQERPPFRSRLGSVWPQALILLLVAAAVTILIRPAGLLGVKE